MFTMSGRPLCLMGNVVDSQGRSSVKTILVENGKIKAIHSGKVPLSLPNLLFIELASDEVIFPGLVNLHVHSQYNIFPLWNSPTLWSNRYQWRNNEQYLREIQRFRDYIDQNWRRDSFDFVRPVFQALATEKHLALTDFSWTDAIREVQKMHGVITELQAVAGGTTLIQQTIKLDNDASLPTFVVRNTGAPLELGLPPTQKVFSVVDFIKPGPNFDPSGNPAHASDDTSAWPLMLHPSFEDFQRSLRHDNDRYYATIAHLAEGRSGYLQRSGPDGFSRREFPAFRQVIEQVPNKTALKKANLILTHACGLDYTDPATLDFLRDNRISIVWSPVSNLLLYRDTLPIRTILDHGINVCLGSDWAPSGSKHVWDELKFARYFCDQLLLEVSNAQLVAMITQNPATALGHVKVGHIEVSYNADFFVLRKANIHQSALDALLTQDDSAVRCTIVNGRVVYGDEVLFVDRLPVDYQRLPSYEGKAAAQKAVSINSSLNFDLPTALLQINSLMQRYASEASGQSNFQRSHFLSADDYPYQNRIRSLKNFLADLVKH